MPQLLLPIMLPYVISGNLLFISGRLPFVDGALTITGKVGADVTAEQAQEQARYARLTSWPRPMRLAKVIYHALAAL